MATTIACPQGFVAAPSNTKCYSRVSTQLDARACFQTCASLGATPPCPSDSADASFLVAQLYSLYQRPLPFWTSFYQTLSDKVGRTHASSGWRWGVEGCVAPYLRNYRPNDRSCREEPCAVMNTGSSRTRSELLDLPCTSRFDCVCQWPANATAPYAAFFGDGGDYHRSGERIEAGGCGFAIPTQFLGLPMLLCIFGCIFFRRNNRYRRTRHRNHPIGDAGMRSAGIALARLPSRHSHGDLRSDRSSAGGGGRAPVAAATVEVAQGIAVSPAEAAAAGERGVATGRPVMAAAWPVVVGGGGGGSPAVVVATAVSSPAGVVHGTPV